ncbi:hypothetical protein ACP275_07G097100 [Erythranthe tilingii]
MELKPILLIVLFIFSSTEKIQSSRLGESVGAESPYNNVETNDYYGEDPVFGWCRSVKCDTIAECGPYECTRCGDNKRCLP